MLEQLILSGQGEKQVVVRIPEFKDELRHITDVNLEKKIVIELDE